MHITVPQMQCTEEMEELLTVTQPFPLPIASGVLTSQFDATHILHHYLLVQNCEEHGFLVCCLQKQYTLTVYYTDMKNYNDGGGVGS